MMSLISFLKAPAKGDFSSICLGTDELPAKHRHLRDSAEKYLVKGEVESSLEDAKTNHLLIKDEE
jgi:hypothetical protein